jgi:hypothetical protein
MELESREQYIKFGKYPDAKLFSAIEENTEQQTRENTLLSSLWNILILSVHQKSNNHPRHARRDGKESET